VKKVGRFLWSEDLYSGDVVGLVGSFVAGVSLPVLVDLVTNWQLLPRVDSAKRCRDLRFAMSLRSTLLVPSLLRSLVTMPSFGRRSAIP
jgi:hypothetical protein